MIEKSSTVHIRVFGFLYFLSLIGLISLGFAQDSPVPGTPSETASAIPAITPEETLSSLQNVTLDFKEADIHNVLKIISYKSGVNIVATPEVAGTVTIRLVDVPWEKALDILLKTYGYGYERQGNIILVTKLENISKIQSEEPLRTEAIVLRFMDAQDIQKVVIPLLSPRGKISILYTKGQKGWQFGSFRIGKETVSGAVAKEIEEKAPPKETVAIEKTPTGQAKALQLELPSSVKSKILVVTDTPAVLEKIRAFILEVDLKPRQVLVETKIIEVNRDKLKDLGVDFGTNATVGQTNLINRHGGASTAAAGVWSLGSNVKPSNFAPLVGTSVSGIPGTSNFSTGLELLYEKITGSQFTVLLHALEEDVNTNTLSAPRILTLDNQEASILVGYHTPIIKSEVTGGSATEPAKLAQTLDYYQEIGIRLNVVPQISEDNYINMIIHPSVTSSTSSVTVASAVGNLTANVSYPIIDVREAQTQVLMQDGETVVIGGLMKDVTSKSVLGVPFLSKIPWIGKAFSRDTIDKHKIELLIFITAHVIKEGELSQEQVTELQNNLGKEVIFKSKVKR